MRKGSSVAAVAVETVENRGASHLGAVRRRVESRSSFRAFHAAVHGSGPGAVFHGFHGHNSSFVLLYFL